LLEGCPIVSPRTDSPAARGVPIPRRALIVSEPFGARLSAEEVAAAIAKGLVEGGRPQPDMIALEQHEELAAQLVAAHFDRRLHDALALILATPELQERTLAGSPAFEIATRARQSGVPAYAVTAENRFDPFDARILDLQLILEAADGRGLAAAGRRLAPVLSAGIPDTRR
jgi:hypothetical protein